MTTRCAQRCGSICSVDVEPSRKATVGATTVRRALPRRERRTVGAWCFADHIGPTTVSSEANAAGPGGIGPHPHIGLQTVTWLVAGELLHRDSLGTEQSIRPGQLNLMTAGHGIAHAEESAIPTGGSIHGIQLWVAQPETTRHAAADFEHHADLPRLHLDNMTATVLVGELATTRSPARTDTDHVGAELRLHPGSSTVPVRPDHEHAIIVLDGHVSIRGTPLVPGEVGLLDPGPDEVTIDTDTPSLLMYLGGTPFPWVPHMWWNFVARERAEIDAAYDDWNDGTDRFGTTGSELERIDVGPPPWRRRVG